MSDTRKRTRWYPRNIFPARSGQYEVRCTSKESHRMVGTADYLPDRPYQSDWPYLCSKCEWRGLAEKPE